MKARPNLARAGKGVGYVLYEAEDFAVIATTLSENEKTGDMVQVWIIHRHMSPIQAVLTGADEVVCFDCIHRGTSLKDHTCYVNLIQGLGKVFDGYQAARYPYLDPADYDWIFTGRAVRLGAYGEPVLIPLEILKRILRYAWRHTGYTHQWRRPEFRHYRRYLMASCDSEADYSLAKSKGWRTFRVRASIDAPLFAREITCPAADEAGKRTQCIRCGLCDGVMANDPRKDIAIVVHGSRAKNFVSLDQLVAA